MLKRIYRQRRRFVFALIAVALAVGVDVVGNDAIRYELKHTFDGSLMLFVVSMALAMLIVGWGLCLVLVMCAPSLRRVIEAAGIAGVLSALILRADAILPAWANEGWVGWILFMCLFYVVSFILEKNMGRGMGLKFSFRSCKSRTIAATPDAIWAAMAPDAELIGTHWTKSLAQVDPRPDIGPDTVDVRYHMGPPMSLVQTQTRRIWERPFHLLYDFEPKDTPTSSAHGVRGSFEMVCDPQPDGRTRLTVTHDYRDVGLGTWLLIWLDDIVGSELDAVQARLTGRRDWSLAGWAARRMAGA